MSLVGSLEDLGLGEILQIVSLSRRSGVLYLAHQAKKGMIVFKTGQVISASTNEKKINFATELLKRGYITSEQLRESYPAWKNSGSKMPYSQYIIEKYNVPLDMLNEINKKIIEEIIFGFFEWTEGSFNFELKESEEEIDGLLSSPLYSVLEPGLSPQFLAMEGTRLFDEKRSKKIADQEREAPEPVEPEVNLHVQPETKPEIEKGTGEDTFSLTGLFNEMRPELEQSEALFPDTEEVSRVESSPGLNLLKSMMVELMNPDTTPEISLLILRFASELMNRAVLLLVKKHEVCGLGGFGIDLGKENPDRVVREIKIPLDEPSIFREAVIKKYPLKRKMEPVKWHDYFLNKLGGGTPSEVYVAPIFTIGKVAALIYGDNLPADRMIGDTSSLEIFLSQAGLAMEKALLRRKLQELKGADKAWIKQ